MTDKNLKIWEDLRTPNPKFVKPFQRPGGFSGASTNATYIYRRLTEQFGPAGKGWGTEVVEDSYFNGAPIIKDGETIGHEIVHIVRGRLWWTEGNEVFYTPEQYGQTMMVVARKNGTLFTDEEAPKKSMTDMIVKCASQLGMAADVFMGLWDDNKYVADAQKQFTDDSVEPTRKTKELSDEEKAELAKLVKRVDEPLSGLETNLEEAQEDKKIVPKQGIEATFEKIKADMERYKVLDPTDSNGLSKRAAAVWKGRNINQPKE